MNIIGFYHGKLRGTYRYPSKVEANDDFLEKLKEETFAESTIYAGLSGNTPLMIASLRIWKGQAFSVFTYFISSRDAANRAGGYIAITVIIKDCLVSERKKMFSIFEEAHSKLQIEKVLDSKKILIEYFDEKKDFFNSLMSDITNSINNHCGPFVKIPVYSIEGEPTAFNVEDCNSESFIKALAESGFCYISQNFTSMKENNEYKKKYEDALNAIEQLKQKAKDSRSDPEGRMLHGVNANLQSKLSELEERNAFLEQNLGEVAAVIERVGKNVQKTRGIVGKSAEKAANSSSPWVRFSLVFTIVNTLLLGALLSLVWSNMKDLKKNLADRQNNVKMEQPIIGGSQIEQGVPSVVEAVQDIQEPVISSQEPAQPINLNKESQSISKTKDVKILIQNQNKTAVLPGGKVSPNDILTVSCENPIAKDYDLFAKDGCWIYNQKNIVISSNSATATFYYCHPDDKNVPFEKQPNKRTLNIVKVQ